MNAFMCSRRDPDDLKQLNTVTEILASRPVKERVALSNSVQQHLQVNADSENYESAANLRDMLDHLRKYVL